MAAAFERNEATRSRALAAARPVREAGTRPEEEDERFVVGGVVEVVFIRSSTYGDGARRGGGTVSALKEGPGSRESKRKPFSSLFSYVV
jgi:hypothetical protein